MGHTCEDGEWSDEPAYWRDAQGIELCKTCDRCGYNSWIGFEGDVDEEIEPDDSTPPGWGER